MSPREEVYTRHGGKGGDRGKILAEMMNAEGKPEVLDDILVLDVSSANFAGIVAASFFAEFGAEVLKIEPPEGDPARLITPFGVTVQGVGVPFMFEGRNKRYMTLDVKNNPEDRKVFARLSKKAAVVIESFAPGEMDGWGIGYRQLVRGESGVDLHRAFRLRTVHGQGQGIRENAGYGHYVPGGFGASRADGRAAQ